MHCTEINHIEEIDTYTRDVLKAMDVSINTVGTTKRTNIKGAKVVPGWSEMVKPFCDEAKFWAAVWSSAGKPINTTLHQIMKRARNQYHYALRRCKMAADKVKKDKLLHSCVNGKNNIFDELHKGVKGCHPSRIDNNENPAARFAEVYEDLYCSANDSEETESMFAEIETLINTESIDDVELVTPDVIMAVSKEIKANKKDPVFSFNSTCVKRAPEIFHRHIANIIRLFLIHGHVSSTLLVATIVPLIKDKLGNAESSDNYRSIALSSVILKMFDWVVIDLFGDKLNLDQLQFSYQKDCSTTMCTWLVVETINHYKRNQTNVYSCFMDIKRLSMLLNTLPFFESYLREMFRPSS